jgi:GcrA cell cycle regulator
MPAWTQDRIDQVCSLWREGLSAREVAKRLGGGCSRNAVIGVIARAGLARKTMRFDWTEAAEATLKRLWDEGAGAGQIAQQLGCAGANSVYAKARELRLPPRREERAIARRRAAAAVQASRAPAPAREARPTAPRTPDGPPILVEPATLQAVTLLELGARQCRFPMGEAAGADQLFCGAPGEGAYCVRHAAVAFNGGAKSPAEALRAAKKLGGWIDKLEGRRAARWAA